MPRVTIAAGSRPSLIEGIVLMRALLMALALGLYVLAGLYLPTAVAAWLGQISSPSWAAGGALSGLFTVAAYSVQRTSRHYRGV